MGNDVVRDCVYVTNIPEFIDEDRLKALFGNYGTVVSVKVYRDKRTGRSKKTGLVKMSTKKEAKLAIEELNYATIEGERMIARVFRGNRNFVPVTPDMIVYIPDTHGMEPKRIHDLLRSFNVKVDAVIVPNGASYARCEMRTTYDTEQALEIGSMNVGDVMIQFKKYKECASSMVYVNKVPVELGSGNALKEFIRGLDPTIAIKRIEIGYNDKHNQYFSRIRVENDDDVEKLIDLINDSESGMEADFYNPNAAKEREMDMRMRRIDLRRFNIEQTDALKHTLESFGEIENFFVFDGIPKGFVVYKDKCSADVCFGVLSGSPLVKVIRNSGNDILKTMKANSKPR